MEREEPYKQLAVQPSNDVRMEVSRRNLLKKQSVVDAVECFA
jgi:hypothetical protein